jgi:AcrR family transcriptional regulator
MRTFWRAGYEATSTEELCAATGLGRSSLYNTFTSKRALFERALECYVAGRTGALLELLDGPGPAGEKVRTVLRDAVDADPGDPAGCLVVNTMVEFGADDAVVGPVLRRDRRRRLDALSLAIAAGQRDGDIASRRSPDELAEFVAATISGLRVAARGGVDRAAREAIAATALDALTR